MSVYMILDAECTTLSNMKSIKQQPHNTLLDMVENIVVGVELQKSFRETGNLNES